MVSPGIVKALMRVTLPLLHRTEMHDPVSPRPMEILPFRICPARTQVETLPSVTRRHVSDRNGA